MSTDALILPSQIKTNDKFRSLLEHTICGKRIVARLLKREQNLAVLERHFGSVNFFSDHEYTLSLEETRLWRVTMKHVLAIHEQHKLRLRDLQEIVFLSQYHMSYKKNKGSVHGPSPKWLARKTTTSSK